MSNATNEAMNILLALAGVGAGTRTILIELYHRQSFDVDSGYIEERVETCTDCLGSGERTVADEDDEEC
jgi:hypothetical protein